MKWKQREKEKHQALKFTRAEQNTEISTMPSFYPPIHSLKEY